MPTFTALHARIEGSTFHDLGASEIEAASIEEAADRAPREVNAQRTHEHQILALTRGLPRLYDADGNVLPETDTVHEKASTFVTQILRMEELGRIRLEAASGETDTILVKRTDQNEVAYRLEGQLLHGEGGLPGLPRDLAEPVDIGSYRRHIWERLRQSGGA